MPHIQLTQEWSLDLEDGYKRRVEDGNLILWKPGRTLWIAVFSGEFELAEELDQIKADSNPKAVQTWEIPHGLTHKYGYLLPEGDGDNEAWALNTFTLVPNKYIMISFYFDAEEDKSWAGIVWKSVTWHGSAQ